MLSVLHVMGRMAPSGTEFQLAGMLRAARDAQDEQWRPTLCVLRSGFPLAHELAGEGIPLIELDARGRSLPQVARALHRITHSGDYDVVHTSLWGASAFGRACAVGRARPAVVMSERRVEDFRGRPQRLVDRALARVTDEWIGNSRDVCDFVGRAHGAPAARVHLIRNAVDTAVFHPGDQLARPARAPGAPARIGALGRLVHQKGFDVLIDALRRLPDTHPVELTVVGEGELRADLEQRASGLPVRFPGPLTARTDVADFLRGLDLFVMPSRFEGLPNAVLEALACGVPTVATAVPGMAEALGPQVRLVPTEDPVALAAAITAALDHPEPIAGHEARSFAAVAQAHRDVFDLAVRRRA